MYTFSLCHGPYYFIAKEDVERLSGDITTHRYDGRPFDLAEDIEYIVLPFLELVHMMTSLVNDLYQKGFISYDESMCYQSKFVSYNQMKRKSTLRSSRKRKRGDHN